MEKSSKNDLIDIIGKQKEQLTRYECRLRDVVTAYKGLLKEKEALDAGLKALNGSSGGSDRSRPKSATSEQPAKDGNKAINTNSFTEEAEVVGDLQEKKTQDMETVEQLRGQLSTLMNSLATLSAEKSRMEASFQADKKQLRAEKDTCEKVAKDLHDRLQNLSKQRQIDVDTIKSKLIVERHLREKEQNDHGVMIRELQKLLSEERRAKEKLESQIDDMRCKVSSFDGQSGQNEQYEKKLQELKSELESCRRKLKRAETKASETPPLLLDLQEEMAKIKAQHQKAIREEQKRAADAESVARGLAEKHEERVANLEARLAELSTTVGSYDRLRQQDQLSIQRLKEHIAHIELEQSIMPGRGILKRDSEKDLKGKSESDLSLDLQSLITKILHLKGQLIVANQRSEKPIDIHAVLNPDNSSFDASSDIHSNCREEYQLLEQKFEFYKLQNAPQKIKNLRKKSEDKGSVLEGQIQVLKERIQILNSQLDDAERESKEKSEHFTQVIRNERAKNKEDIAALEADFKNHIFSLEQQLQKQRERSLNMLEEKEEEIKTLKSTFQMFLPGHTSSESPRLGSEHPGSGAADDVMSSLSQFGGIVRGMGPMGGGDSPHMLHYAHELSRRDVEISNLRKAKYGLECTLREIRREDSTQMERYEEKINKLEEEVARLERCKSREGANLEYLKNVVLSFLTSSKPSSKQHMLNAIAAVLKFSNAELEKVIGCPKSPVT